MIVCYCRRCNMVHAFEYQLMKTMTILMECCSEHIVHIQGIHNRLPFLIFFIYHCIASWNKCVLNFKQKAVNMLVRKIHQLIFVGFIWTLQSLKANSCHNANFVVAGGSRLTTCDATSYDSGGKTTIFGFQWQKKIIKILLCIHR